jgi:hypothetical protein
MLTQTLLLLLHVMYIMRRLHSLIIMHPGPAGNLLFCFGHLACSLTRLHCTELFLSVVALEARHQSLTTRVEEKTWWNEKHRLVAWNKGRQHHL